MVNEDENNDIYEDYDHMHAPQFMQPQIFDMNYHQHHDFAEYHQDWHYRQAELDDAFMDIEDGYHDSDAIGMTMDHRWYPIWEEGNFHDEEWSHHYDSTQWEHEFVVEQDGRFIDRGDV